MDTIKMKNLLDSLKTIPVKTVFDEPTFLDISGYPHYENVCSNILQFFFQSEESHGMKDFFIQALLKAAGENSSHEIIVIDVLREQPTSKGNRLDIVISTDEYLIGIENKIFADFYNDLDDYSGYLNNISNGRKICKMIMSIQKVPIRDTSGFINITYNKFFNCLDELIGQYWTGAKQKYLIYLKDFMQTIKSFERTAEMDNDMMNFFKENREEAENFMEVVNDLKKSLRQQVQNLGEKLTYDDIRCKQWFYRETDKLFDVLVHDITAGDAIVTISSRITPEGWGIRIWLRKPGFNQLRNKNDLAIWLVEKGISNLDIKVEEQERPVYFKTYTHQNIDDGAKHLQELLDKLCE